MESGINAAAEALNVAIQTNVSNKQLVAILKSHLYAFHKRDYDTEEKEFIGDLFHELASIVNIDFSNHLDRWLYGSVSHTFFKLGAALSRKKETETISEPCSGCGVQLETLIISKQRDIPDFSWNIVKCKACGAYSIVSYGPQVKEIRYTSYELIEQLPKDQFSRQEAEIRLEQLRHFRK